MRRLGVDLLIQPEEEDPTTAEDTDQIQQRAVVSPSEWQPHHAGALGLFSSLSDSNAVFYQP